MSKDGGRSPRHPQPVNTSGSSTLERALDNAQAGTRSRQAGRSTMDSLVGGSYDRAARIRA